MVGSLRDLPISSLRRLRGGAEGRNIYALMFILSHILVPSSFHLHDAVYIKGVAIYEMAEDTN